MKQKRLALQAASRVSSAGASAPPQAFCAAKPWRRANSLRPSILISCRNPKKEVTTYVVTSFFGAGDEARSRHCRAATRTAGDKRPTGAFSRFARALFDPLPAETKKSALLRRTSVLRSKTLAEGEFTSPEHFNFLPESKKRGHNIRCDLFFWSGRRGSLAALPCRDTHSGRQTPHRGVFSLRSRPVRPSAR